MPDSSQAFDDLIRLGREDRNVEYKGSSGQDPFTWVLDPVRSRIAKTAMAMANIGGGYIVIGMDQTGPDAWQPNGVSVDVDVGYQQDMVQPYVNDRADPYVQLTVSHVNFEGRRFIVIQVNGFDELPVVCASNGTHIHAGAVYTRPFGKHETAAIQTQSEMRELLDRAIAVGVQKRLRPVFKALRETLTVVAPPPPEEQFEAQRGEL